jgi:hypothetical protein
MKYVYILRDNRERYMVYFNELIAFYGIEMGKFKRFNQTATNCALCYKCFDVH